MKPYILRDPKAVEPQNRKRNPLLNPHDADPGGKIMSSSTREVKSRAATALRLAAQGLDQAQNYFGDLNRRWKVRWGTPEAITAMTARIGLAPSSATAEQGV